MLDELNAMVETMTKQIRDLEKQVKVSEVKAKGAQDKVTLEECEALAKITAIQEQTAKRIAEIQAQLPPYEQRLNDLHALDAKLTEIRAAIPNETKRLTNDQRKELSDMAKEIAAESARLASIRREVAQCKAKVAEL